MIQFPTFAHRTPADCSAGVFVMVAKRAQLCYNMENISVKSVAENV